MANYATRNKGQIAIFTVLMVSVMVMFMVVLTGALLQDAQAVGRSADTSLSQQLAESGIDQAIWCLNHPTECPANYTGETQAQGAGKFTVTTSLAGNITTIDGTGTVNGRTVTIRQRAQNTSSANASFYYGVQSGTGGIKMNNNSKIIGANNTPGNVYVDGSISIAGGNGTGTEISGDAVLAMSAAAADAVSDPPSPYTVFDVTGSASTRYVAQSFVPTVTDKVVSVDLKIARTNSAPNSPTLSLYYDNGSGKPGTMVPGAQIALNPSGLPVNAGDGWKTGFTNVIFTPSTMITAGVQYWLVLQVSGANSTKFFTMVRSTTDASYASGVAMVGNDLSNNLNQLCSTPTSCDLAFKINMGGVQPTLEIEKVGGVARSYSMKKATVQTKAYYRQITEDHAVYGNNGADECMNDENGPNCFDLDFSGGSDPVPQPFPLSDAQIGVWEEAANAGGTVTCATPCTISSGTVGPKKYIGNVTIDNTVTLAGTIWVKGNLTMNNGALLKLSDAYGSDSGVIIADNQDSDLTKVQSGRIITNADSAFLRNATTGTYIIGIAMSASQDVSLPAFDIGNNFSKVSQNPLASAVVYAPRGMVHINQNGELKEVTAQTLYLENNAIVSYETGLSSIIFSSGPGGAWKPLPGTWQPLSVGGGQNQNANQNANAAPVNHPPVLNAVGDKSVLAGSLLTFSLTGSDPDGNQLSYSANNLPAGATLNGQTFSWTPTAQQSGAFPNVSFAVSDGTTTDSETITITVTQDTTPPTAPGNPTMSNVAENGMTISWNACTDAGSGLKEYKLFSCSGVGCMPNINGAALATIAGSVQSPSYADSGLTRNTSYSYQVVAYDNANNSSSSSVVTQSTLPDQSVPTAPSQITFTAGSSYNIIDLSWTGMTDTDGTADITQYSLYRCVGNGCITATPYTTTATPSYHQINLTGNTVYGYAVVAKDASGNTSPLSSWFYVQTGTKYNPGPIPLGG